jgi:hypothetical protein
MCILRKEVLQKRSMAPSKLKRHFKTKYSEHKTKPPSSFQSTSILNNPSSVKEYIHTQFKSENETALMAP